MAGEGEDEWMGHLVRVNWKRGGKRQEHESWVGEAGVYAVDSVRMTSCRSWGCVRDRRCSLLWTTARAGVSALSLTLERTLDAAGGVLCDVARNGCAVVSACPWVSRKLRAMARLGRCALRACSLWLSEIYGSGCLCCVLQLA